MGSDPRENISYLGRDDIIQPTSEIHDLLTGLVEDASAGIGLVKDVGRRPLVYCRRCREDERKSFILVCLEGVSQLLRH